MIEEDSIIADKDLWWKESVEVPGRKHQHDCCMVQTLTAIADRVSPLSCSEHSSQSLMPVNVEIRGELRFARNKLFRELCFQHYPEQSLHQTCLSAADRRKLSFPSKNSALKLTEVSEK
jgi:hypothetical protein